MILRAKISGIGVKLWGHHPEATYRSNIPSLWGATSASFEMSSYLHVCQPTMCKVTGHRPSRKVMSLNHITVIPGIGKPKYVHTYLQKYVSCLCLALWFNFSLFLALLIPFRNFRFWSKSCNASVSWWSLLIAGLEY